MENQTYLITNILLGCLAMFSLIVVIILFVVIHKRKILLKDTKIKLLENEKQLALFKASVEAEENQKEKIAFNLHDEINPMLNTLKFNLTKHRVKAEKNELIPSDITVDEKTLNKVIDGIRTICHDLVPTFFFEYGLLVSLESYLKNIQRMEHITGEFKSELNPDDLETFTRHEQLNIYRVCLEVLNNLFKHSGCTFFNVLIKSKYQSLVFEITHNGKGISNEEMDTFTAKSTGLGLKSLKARIILLNATINYNKNINTPSITLTIPLNPNNKM